MRATCVTLKKDNQQINIWASDRGGGVETARLPRTRPTMDCRPISEEMLFRKGEGMLYLFG